MDEVQPLPEPNPARNAIVVVAAVVLAIVLLGDVWLLLRSDTRRVPPPVEPPHVRAQRLLDEARAKALADAHVDEVVPLLDQAIDVAPMLAEARLLRIHVSLPLYLDRRAVLDASPLLDQARIPADPALDRLRTTMLSDAAALGVTTIDDKDRAEVAAIEAFLTNKPVPGGVLPRIRIVRSWQLLTEGKARPAMQECDVPGPPGDPLFRWTLAHSLLAVRREEPGRDALADSARELLASLPESTAVLLDLAEADPASELDTLARALTLAPGEPSILARLAEAEERAGDLAQALAWACQALDAAPDVAGLLLLRARIHARSVQVHQARETYDRARRLHPDRADVLRARAAFLLRTGGAEKALGDAERAMEIEPCEETLALVCEALTANGQPDVALRRSVQKAWTRGPLLIARSRAMRALQRYDEVKDDLVAPGIHFEGDPAEKALAALAMGELYEAGRLAEQADGPDGWEALARVRVANGSLSRVPELLEKTLAADPLRAPANALLGQVLVKLDKLVDAEEALTRAVEIDPTCAEAWRGMAELRLAQGNPVEALKALDQAVEHGRGEPEAVALRAEARRRSRDFDGALADIDEALRVRPDHGPWLLVRAEVKLARNDAEGARADAEAACKALRDSAPVWSALARAALAQGDLDTTEKALDRTFILDPRHVPTRVCSARLALARSQRDKARSELGIALNVDPDDADALHLRAKIAVEDTRWQEAVEDLERFLAKHAADQRRPEVIGWLDLARKGLRNR